MTKKAEDEAVAMEKFLCSVDNLATAKDPFLLTEEIDSFSKISTESNRLVEIIDIRDELDIIKSVLTTQKKVLKQLRDSIRSEGRASTSENPDGKYSSEVRSDVKSSKAYGDTASRNLVAVEDALWIVDDNLTRVKEMDDSATRVHDSVSLYAIKLFSDGYSSADSSSNFWTSSSNKQVDGSLDTLRSYPNRGIDRIR